MHLQKVQFKKIMVISVLGVGVVVGEVVLWVWNLAKG